MDLKELVHLQADRPLLYFSDDYKKIYAEVKLYTL